MFKDCTLFVLLQESNGGISVRRVMQDCATQKLVNEIFSKLVLEYTDGLSKVPFDGKYTPSADDKEYLYIEEYSVPEEIKSAISNPLGIEIYTAEEQILPKIKALFLGKKVTKNGIDQYTIAFQKFKNDQYISQSKIHLFLSGNTFTKDSRVGITISKCVDCVFRNDTLEFKSYHFTKQILDLSEYYRIASSADIENFTKIESVEVSDSETYIIQADTWERRKIASILDSGVLEEFTPKKIQKFGKNIGIDIEVTKGKLTFPSDKKNRKIFLGFLDEEVYKGVFSNITYQTNSKRKA